LLSTNVCYRQALTAFVFLLLLPSAPIFVPVKISIVIAVLSLPFLWRMGLQSSVDGISGQYQTSMTLGVRRWRYVNFVAWPQLASKCGTLAGIAGFWAVGDFAVSRVIATRDVSIAMMIDSMMSSYRLSLATVMTLSLLVVGVLVFSVIKGVAFVSCRKSFL
jgi:thiamine transport system permease protein